MPARKPAAPKSITLTFEFERETKGTKRFQEVPGDDGEPIIGTLYVRKFALTKLGNPDTLTITLEA